MKAETMRVIGIDPGLRRTGWGIVERRDGVLTHCADGVIETDADAPTPERLRTLFHELDIVLTHWRPAAAAMETIFVNRNAASTLKLAQARGALLSAIGVHGLEAAEYSPNLVKKAVTGRGHAAKSQIHAMIARLLPNCKAKNDAADALAAAIAHLHSMPPTPLRRAAERAAPTPP